MRDRAKKGAQVTNISQCYGASYHKLDIGAKAIYRARCRELIEKGELCFSDLAELALYARSLQMTWEFDADIKKMGNVLEYGDKMGNVRFYANPAIKLFRDALNDVGIIGARFGFEPLSRKKLAMEMETAEDEVDLFFKAIAGGQRSGAQKSN